MTGSLLIRLTKELTTAQLKSRYRRTVAGFLWVVLSPILIYSVQAFIFKHVLQIQVPNYAIFLLGGLLPWVFFSSSLDMGIPVLTSSKHLLSVFRVPPAVLISSSILDNWINFIAAFLIILIPCLLLNTFSWSGLLMLPLALIVLLTGIGGIVFFASLFNVFYRDVKYVLHLGTNILFFLTPIFYPIEFIPEKFRFLASLNPLYILISPVRICIYSFSFEAFVPALFKAALVSLVLASIAKFYWRKRINELYHFL